MKLSRFNVVHEDKDGALIMNARSGGGTAEPKPSSGNRKFASYEGLKLHIN